MLIYEVNLKINVEIYAEYTIWLNAHIQEILNLPGFNKALLLTEENATNQTTKNITVQYHLDSQKHLDNYLINQAPKMRAEGLRKFNQQFTAVRRILKIDEIFQKT